MTTTDFDRETACISLRPLTDVEAHEFARAWACVRAGVKHGMNEAMARFDGRFTESLGSAPKRLPEYGWIEAHS